MNIPLLLLQTAFAATSASSAATAEDWSTCQKSVQCIVSVDECDKPVAIHKKFVKEREGRNQLSQCAVAYKGPPKEAFRAVCEGKKCSLEKK